MSIDAEVAEKVMGWHSVHTERHGEEWHAYGLPPDKEFDCTPVPKFTTDPTADYAALARVRETWDYAARERMDTELARVWDARGLEHLAYEPGDYSRAALAALAVGKG